MLHSQDKNCTAKIIGQTRVDLSRETVEHNPQELEPAVLSHYPSLQIQRHVPKLAAGGRSNG